MATASQIESPPRLPWPEFSSQFVATWQQGQHCLFNGPSGSGKTVAARTFARARDWVCVLGTKMRDPEMEAYLAEGYVRIDHWPPTRSDYRKGREYWDDGEVRFVIWPAIRSGDDLNSTQTKLLFNRALKGMLGDGGWTIVADEGLWISSKTGLDLGARLDHIAYTGRSSKVTLMMLTQRPRGVPVNCWTNASYAFLWHMGNTDDAREMASLGTTERRSVQVAVQQLRGHDFLFLPCRAGMDWAVSRVELDG